MVGGLGEYIAGSAGCFWLKGSSSVSTFLPSRFVGIGGDGTRWYVTGVGEALGHGGPSPSAGGALAGEWWLLFLGDGLLACCSVANFRFSSASLT